MRRTFILRLLAGLVLCGLPASPSVSPAWPAEGRIVIGSKNFMESRLLAEMFAQLVEERTQLQVER